MAWESFPGVEPLTPASRLNGVIILKHLYISLIIGDMALECKNNTWEVLVYKCFWPYFEKKKKKNGRHSQLFQNH